MQTDKEIDTTFILKLKLHEIEWLKNMCECPEEGEDAEDTEIRKAFYNAARDLLVSEK